MMGLRPYQQEAVNAINEHWKEWRKELLVLPTGCGKTRVFNTIAHERDKVLILAHREELIEQARDAYESLFGVRPGKIKAAEEDIQNVTVGSIQTMTRRNYSGMFDTIIIDEAHHAVSDSYLNVLSQFPNAKVLGVTATADRGDRKSLSTYFDGIAYDYPLKKAVQEGYLSPIVARTVPLEIDMSEVKVSVGDFELTSIAQMLTPYLPKIAEAIKEYAADRKTIVFMPLVKIAQEFRDILIDKGIDAREVNGNSTDRKEVLEWFHNAGKGSVLVNSMLLTEGYDEPSIDCVVVLRPTKVRGLYCLDTKTEVLTKDGWKTDVEVGEKVLAYDTETGETRFVPALAKVRRFLGKDEYFVSLNAPSEDIRVTNKHRIIYDNKRKKGWKIKTAEEVADMTGGVYLPASGHGKFKGVPLSDDELRFIGWVMTDGNINKSTHAISISQGEHQPWLNRIEECIKGCGMKYGKYANWRKTQFNQTSRNITFTVSYGEPRGQDKDKHGWAYLEDYISKDLSPNLFEMTEAQFDVMMEAIHLADGNKQLNQEWTRRSYHIHKGNKTFLERLQMMAIQRGYRANLKQERENFYVLHMKKLDRICVANYKGHSQWVKEDHTDEECWCVQTELGTLVTRRNGKTAIVGNCQMVGRGTRTSEGKKNLLLLDFLWLCQRHNLCRPASLVSENEEDVKHVVRQTTANEIDLFGAVADAEEARRNALAEALRKQARKKERLVDPLTLFDVLDDMSLADYSPSFAWEMEDATDKQINLLHNFGIDGEGLTKGYASLVLDKVLGRSNKKMATVKQIKLLKKFRYNPTNWTYDQASAKITALSRVGWCRWKLRD